MDIDNDSLLTELALSLPNGAFTSLARWIAHCHEASHNAVQRDTSVQGLDKKITCGHLRRAYVNSALRAFANAYGLPATDVREGTGIDNHVEIRINRLVLTCHHVGRNQKLPPGAKYIEQNSELNELFSQMELFSLDGPVEPSVRDFNVLVIHDSGEVPGQVNDIRFVFPRAGQILATFSIGDIIAKQSMIEQMDQDQQIELRARFNTFRRKLGG